MENCELDTAAVKGVCNRWITLLNACVLVEGSLPVKVASCLPEGAGITACVTALVMTWLWR